jgi:putative SOS response-associated peptidase YedK
MVPGMRNDYRSHVDLDTIRRDFSEIRIRIHFPEGASNLQPRDDIRITETAPIIRPDGDPGIADLVQRRWSWPERGQPVYNFPFGEPRVHQRGLPDCGRRLL